ncbi:hypothetical protein [Paenibacillus sp. MSJ-34]|uniref:hypothetical protein n=1 Tax=Paenibacillus sp. MSJ-34 TaxID=2841529 RepID=UPI00209DC7F7|nr:hypothetical protein [Paenibacillus sp. MSJ-34]
MILYLTSKDRVNLLDFAEKETNLIAKKLTGRFSLMQFVIKDMRNFSHFKYFVIDRDAVLEDDAEFVKAIASFQIMYEARVIVIAEGLQTESSFAKELIQSGVTDLVTAQEIEVIQSEILECLSANGMERYKISPSPAQTTNGLSLHQQEQYRFDCTNIRIAIAGSDRRTGVTTTAFNLVCWINNHGGTACYVEANTSKHLAHIVQLFQPEQDRNAYVFEQMDFYFTEELNKDYNFIVIDCGVLGEKLLQEEFVKANIRILCGSAMPYELPIFYKAIRRCKEYPVQALGLFVPGDLQPHVQRLISDNIQFGESSHDLFDSKVNAPVYKRWLSEYILI